MAASAVSVFTRFQRCTNIFRTLNYGGKSYIFSHPYQPQGITLLLAQAFNSRPPDSSESSDAKPKRPKTVPKPRITLIGTDEKITVLLLEEAQKLAKRRSLQLLKVQEWDAKSQRPVYRLAPAHAGSSHHEHVAHKSPQQPHTRNVKQLTFSSKIDQHDVISRTKQVAKWLHKNVDEVRVSVTIHDPAAASEGEKVYKLVEAAVAEFNGRIAQKRTTEHHIKFSILPPKATPAPKSADTPQSPAAPEEPPAK